MFANIYETAKDVSFCVAGCTGDCSDCPKSNCMDRV